MDDSYDLPDHIDTKPRSLDELIETLNDKNRELDQIIEILRDLKPKKEDLTKRAVIDILEVIEKNKFIYYKDVEELIFQSMKKEIKNIIDKYKINVDSKFIKSIISSIYQKLKIESYDFQEKKYLGLSISALIDLSTNEVYIEFENLEIPYLCSYLNKKTVKVKGNVDEYFGYMSKESSIYIEGDAKDHLAFGIKDSNIILSGNAGNSPGAFMESGRLKLRNAGNSVGYCMKGGVIEIENSAKDNVGMFMQGGEIYVKNAGKNTGLNMRGGKIIIYERVEENLGNTMSGGYIKAKEVLGNIGDHIINGEIEVDKIIRKDKIIPISPTKNGKIIIKEMSEEEVRKLIPIEIEVGKNIYLYDNYNDIIEKKYDDYEFNVYIFDKDQEKIIKSYKYKLIDIVKNQELHPIFNKNQIFRSIIESYKLLENFPELQKKLEDIIETGNITEISHKPGYQPWISFYYKDQDHIYSGDIKPWMIIKEVIYQSNNYPSINDEKDIIYEIKPQLIASIISMNKDEIKEKLEIEKRSLDYHIDNNSGGRLFKLYGSIIGNTLAYKLVESPEKNNIVKEIIKIDNIKDFYDYIRDKMKNYDISIFGKEQAQFLSKFIDPYL